MGLCETCQHWKFDRPDWEYDGARLGECKGIRQRETIEEDIVYPEGMDRWGEAAEAIRNAAFHAVKAIAVDGSGYYAGVRTAPDFGCVLHSPTQGDGKP